MEIQLTQEGLLDLVKQDQGRFTEVVHQVSDTDQERPFTQAGWSVKDFIAHMAHWKKVMHALLVAYTHDQPLPPVEASGDEPNQFQRQEYASLSLSEVHAFWQETHTHLLHLIVDELDDKCLLEEVRAPWDEKDTLQIGHVIAEICGHDTEHLDFIGSYFRIGNQ
ncbi:MAG: hypothetical protein NVS4B7_19850 [Ktedonobacteraceae bacterium]